MSLYLALCVNNPIQENVATATEQLFIEKLEKELESKTARVREWNKSTVPIGIRNEACQGVHQDAEEEGEDPEEDASNGEDGDQA